MKVAVTGANGFIGRHVLAELAKYPVEVLAISRSIDTERELPANATAVQLDMQDVSPATFAQLGAPDALIHLAWGGLPNYKSLTHFERELPLQYHFLQTLIRSGLSSLVATGTCFEYGMQSGPLSEQLPAAPNNPYGFAKDSLRQQLEYLRNIQPFALTWARLFYMYGPGQAANSLFPQLQQAVQRGDPVFNMSGGEQLRDYLPVTTVARHLVAMAMAQKDLGVVNVCSGKAISVRQQVENWLAENAWSIALNLGYYPYPDYEPLAFWGTCSKLQNHLE